MFISILNSSGLNHDQRNFLPSVRREAVKAGFRKLKHMNELTKVGIFPTYVLINPRASDEGGVRRQPRLCQWGCQ